VELIARIQSAKLRSIVHHRSFVFGRCARLRKELAAAQSGLSDLLEYIPVAAVAAIETYFRFTIAQLINVGHRFLDGLDELLKEKDVRIDASVLKALHGQKTTIGEVVAYSLRALQHQGSGCTVHVATVRWRLCRTLAADVARIRRPQRFNTEELR
jgi:hypothetical protein